MLFGNQLAQRYSRFAGVFSIVAQYSEEMHGTMAANVAKDRRLNDNKFTTIDEVIDLADSYSRAERASNQKTFKSTLRDKPRPS